MKNKRINKKEYKKYFKFLTEDCNYNRFVADEAIWTVWLNNNPTNDQAKDMLKYSYMMDIIFRNYGQDNNNSWDRINHLNESMFELASSEQSLSDAITMYMIIKKYIIIQNK